MKDETEIERLPITERNLKHDGSWQERHELLDKHDFLTTNDRVLFLYHSLARPDEHKHLALNW